MSDIVLDSSVLLAIFKGEQFEKNALPVTSGAVMSAVNLVEVMTRLNDLRMSADTPEIEKIFSLLDRIEPFTESQAKLAGELRASTRHAGLSLGDRACLALAIELGATAYTADQEWSRITVDCPIHLIR